MNYSTGRVPASHTGTARNNPYRPSMYHQQQRHTIKPSQPGMIQSGTIKNQFQKFTNDLDQFRKEKLEAERKLGPVNEDCKEFKDIHEKAIAKNREAKAKLGQYTMNLAKLKEEEGRNNKLIANDTKAIDSCTDRLKDLEAKKEKNSNAFIGTMGPVNMEIHMTVKERLEKDIGQNITPRTVQAIIVPFIDAKTKAGDPTLANGLFGFQDVTSALNKATAEHEHAEDELFQLIDELEAKGVNVDALLQDDQGGGALENIPPPQENLGRDTSDLFYGHGDAEMHDGFY
ncbi:MAG: hypothetical protein SGILL_007304 [Bacillariaceae sp.]